jgi:hypothetical protein
MNFREALQKRGTSPVQELALSVKR